MFQGFFEWVMGIITYVLSFFGIVISRPAATGATGAAIGTTGATGAAIGTTGGSAITDAVAEDTVASLPSNSSE